MLSVPCIINVDFWFPLKDPSHLFGGACWGRIRAFWRFISSFDEIFDGAQCFGLAHAPNSYCFVVPQQPTQPAAVRLDYWILTNFNFLCKSE